MHFNKKDRRSLDCACQKAVLFKRLFYFPKLGCILQNGSVGREQPGICNILQAFSAERDSVRIIVIGFKAVNPADQPKHYTSVISKQKIDDVD